MAKLHAHVYYSFSEVKFFIKFMQAIAYNDFVVCIKHCFNISPAKLSINNITEYNRAITTSRLATFFMV